MVVVVLVLLQLTSCLPSDSPSNPLWPSPPSEEPPSLSSTSSSSIQRAHRLLNAQYNINTPPNSESTSDGRGDDLAAAVVFEPPHHQQQHQPSRSLSSFSELPIPERKLIPLPVLSSPSSSSSAIDSNRPGISTQLKQAVGLNNHNNNYISLSAKLRTIPEASPSMESSRHASFSFEHNKEQYPGYVLDGMEKMITNQDERPVFTDSDTSFMSDYEVSY